MEKMLDEKFDMLLQRILGSQVAVQQPLQAACNVCNMTNHDFLSCPHRDAYSKFTAEQANSFNNFQRPRYDPYSNFYNPGWRDHPNLKWDKDQHYRPQFQQQVQQPAAPKAYWEIAIEKLANTTNQEIQNLYASMKNMEKQIEQIALQVSERAPDSGQPQDRSKNTAEATTKIAERVYESPMPYPEMLKPKVKDQQLTDFMKTLSKVQINLSLIDAIKNIPYYAKFLKDVCQVFEGRASVNLMPYSVFNRLGEGEPKSTSNIIQLADRSITYPRGVIEDVIVKVDNLYLLADFMVLDMDEDLTTPIILGRPFLATTRTLIDVEAGTLTFRVEDQTVVFKLFEASIHSGDKQECMRVDVLNGLPYGNFVTRSSIGKLPIKTQNVICH
ncbi:uncharacterized protein [Malus domestica]|uniref:uncharacterized protein n=1 Tax=Malus domestica TaxID=3750 RepID=UPI0039748809